MAVVFAAIAALGHGAAAAQESGDSRDAHPDSGLKSIHSVTYVRADWNDGDSFRVRFPDGEEHTLRLYAVDCLEASSETNTDARRIRAQRRYFGIADYETDESITIALDFGEAATERTRELLAEEFSVHTAFAGGGGDARYSRILAFVTTAGGEDLTTQLVKEGLARAHGIARGTPGGTSRDEFREQLADLEMVAATRGRGIWAKTDWDSLPEQRRVEREELAELAMTRNANRPAIADLKINPNIATRRDLEQLPGIGKVTALRIIEERINGSYRSPDDLLRVKGIGSVTLERIHAGLVFD